MPVIELDHYTLQQQHLYIRRIMNFKMKALQRLSNSINALKLALLLQDTFQCLLLSYSTDASKLS